MLALTAAPVRHALNPAPHTTHETYIHAVRDVVLPRVVNPVARQRLADAKLVYGAGAGTGARGVTYFHTWDGGSEKPVDVLEVCAFGEESALQVAGTTVHELGHALAGHGAGHGPEWKRACGELGLTHAEAAGQSYQWEHFIPDVRVTLQALTPPTDGAPTALRPTGFTGARTRTAATPRPCPMGVGTKGGTSRGPGSGSRLRLWVCACVTPVKVRVASDTFAATCHKCDTAFTRG